MFSLQIAILSISVGFSSTASITISWILAEGVTATGYTISYSNTNTDCFSDSSSGISASGMSYTLTDLEEGTEYSINVTATLTGGGTKMSSTTANTMPDSQCILSVEFEFTLCELLSLTAPSGPPSSVRVVFYSPTSVTVKWGSVSCIHQNGEITGYSVRYGEVGSSELSEAMVSGDSSGGMITISDGLVIKAKYTVEVAAETSAGTGVYSDPQIFETLGSE